MQVRNTSRMDLTDIPHAITSIRHQMHRHLERILIIPTNGETYSQPC